MTTLGLSMAPNFITNPRFTFEAMLRGQARCFRKVVRFFVPKCRLIAETCPLSEKVFADL